jgi:hypothetical protein
MCPDVSHGGKALDISYQIGGVRRHAHYPLCYGEGCSILGVSTLAVPWHSKRYPYNFGCVFPSLSGMHKGVIQILIGKASAGNAVLVIFKKIF